MDEDATKVPQYGCLERSVLSRTLPFALGVLISLSSASPAQAQSSDYFSGPYGGFEGGAISYNTQITFDGVDDPAGRGGTGYGVFLGYNHTFEKWLIGGELLFNLASEPDPYTFDPALAGFAELDVLRGASYGVDVRAGYLMAGRLLLFGRVGRSANKQSVRIDGEPLDSFAGGSRAEAFSAFQVGAGLEVAVPPRLSIRISVRSLTGHDLNVTDFGTVASDASLMRFDVEPSQQQIWIGLTFRF